MTTFLYFGCAKSWESSDYSYWLRFLDSLAHLEEIKPDLLERLSPSTKGKK